MRERVAKTARDPREVGERISKLLDKRSIRLRNPVGPDAKLMRLATHVVPFRARRDLLGRVTGIRGAAVR
jgi:hypothetical protein